MLEQTATKAVLKIEITGAVTSFRYPHFAQGRQPTYELPPPATIYGHICSAVGDYINPEGLEFGYHFTHSGKFIDYKEHLHFSDPIQPFPFDRELLFNPSLTLYLNDVNLLEVFQHPHYAVILGRSQDLMTYRSIRLVTLQRANRGYFEQTLLPLAIAPQLTEGVVTMTMPRYIDPRRRATWATYTVVTRSAVWPPVPNVGGRVNDEEGDGFIMESDKQWDELWIDPETPPHRTQRDLHRVVWFHRFVD